MEVRVSRRAVLNPGHVQHEAPVQPTIVGDDEEVWAVCEEYPTNLISSHGRVWSLAQHRLRSSGTKEGWYKVMSFSSGRGRLLHRLVAKAFVPGYFDGAVVNHKDGVKSNNLWSNLEWVTNADNIRHAFATGLRPTMAAEKVEAIRAAVSETKRTFKDIAAEHRVDASYVASLADGEARGLPALNTDHRPRRGKLSRDEVLLVIDALKAGDLTYKEIAQQFGVTHPTVSNIAAGRYWPELTAGLGLAEDRRRKGWELRRRRLTNAVE